MHSVEPYNPSGGAVRSRWSRCGLSGLRSSPPALSIELHLLATTHLARWLLCARSSHLQKSGSKPPTESKRAGKTAESLELEEEVARWELDSREIQLGAKIGKGAFGVVYKGTLRGKEVRAPSRSAIDHRDLTGATGRGEEATRHRA